MVTAIGRYRSNQWLLLGTGVIEIIVQAPTAKFGGGTLAIDGYRIPAGAVVASLTYLIHQHPESWPNPKQFDPERFAPQAESVTRRHPFAWIPLPGFLLAPVNDCALGVILRWWKERWRWRWLPNVLP